MAGFQVEQSTVKTTDNEFLISSVLRNSAVQHVQSGLSTAEQPSFRQHVSTLITNPDLVARDEAKRGLTTIMSQSNIGKPEATTALDFVDTYGAARTHAIKSGNMDHVKQLDDGVASGKYKSTNDVLKQMENWGYHDFVQQQQNANAQNEALVSIVFAIILQGISLLIQQRLQQMQEAKDDEPVRNKYKKDLDDKLGEIGVTSVEAKQKIAEKATDALSDGNLNDAVLV